MTELEMNNAGTPQSDCEFSRPVDVTTIGSSGRQLKLTATEAETEALARRFSVLALSNLKADCLITPTKKGEYRLVASFSAEIVQSCGVSLDPVEERITGDVTVTLLNSSAKKFDNALEIDFEADEEDFEYITSNQIDLGEIIAQHLSLEINPYPRKAEATGEELGYKIIREEDVILESNRKNPFAVLKSLKHKT